MPRWITEGPSAPLAVPLHDNPRERKRGREGERRGEVCMCVWGGSETRATSFLILTLVTLLLPFPALHSNQPASFPHRLLILSTAPASVFLSIRLPLSFFLSFSPSFPHALCTSPSLEQAPIIDGEKRKNKLFSPRRESVRSG